MEGGQEGEERKGAAPVPLIDDSNYSDATDNTNETLMKPLLPEAVVVWSFTDHCSTGAVVSWYPWSLAADNSRVKLMELG